MISLTLKDVTAIVRLTPPEGRFTLLDAPTIKKIIRTLKEVSESPAKVIRIQGGSGCFAVGADLKTMYGYDGFTAKGFSMLGNSLFNLMRTMPQVITGEIDGYCMGGGMDFAAACDFRLATAESVFAHPGTKLGIITGFGGTQAIPRIMKPAASAEFFCTGEMFRSEEMKRGGFLTEIFPSAADMDSYAAHLCAKIAAKDRELLSRMKRGLFHKGL
ncbi:enoyl-CoA hydratase/isomerase family protein [Geovibrio thiophilus]|uniref:Enoyl-CoA hydratase/isomerase family protein n=1 Tax=Geovibrio thiophilus TaxID=139438 RepID=A0A410JVV3_9BACT|nr:enoyl-CoA hydratase/isomerase family protein [Geovibrio thiophilus]QAR32304.1 enoyl-CoA hydratase/isomerase family protein [Geovibrio thiophilus]